MSKGIISREKLIDFSSDCNPTLADELRSGKDLRTILETQFYEVEFDDNNISVNPLSEYILFEFFSDTNKLIILNSDNMVSPVHAYHFNGKIHFGYHPTSRRGTVFGMEQPVTLTRQYYNIYVNSYFLGNLSNNFDEGDYSRFVIEIINHELIGHILLKIDDHINTDPRTCIMAPKAKTK